MTITVASAPGKIVLSGEYAVLNGAPAIAMAVDRRAQVTIRPADGQTHTFEAPGFVEGTFRFRQRGADVEWLDAASVTGAFALFEQVLSAAAFAPSDSLAYCVDTRAFHDPVTGTKLGLGSSAAVAVALAGACSIAIDGSLIAAELAATAHASFQGGRGSGVDIASAAQGGVIRYVRNAASDALSWPEGLHAVAFWSGRSASTIDKLTHADHRAGSSTGRQLDQAARAAARAWAEGEFADLLDALGNFRHCLQAYDEAHAVGIFAGGHSELAAFSDEFPALVYKPCGAGGGDVGMAFGADPEALERFASGAGELGFSRLKLSLDPTGLRIKEQAA